MFPGQQGATCPAQLWPPRPRDQTSGGGAKYGKVRPRGLLSDGITKNRCSQPSFCSRWKTPKWSHINPATPVFSQSPHLRAACIFSLGRPTFATYLCAQTLHIFAYTTPVHGASSTLCTTPLEAGCRTGRTRSCPAPASAPHPQRIGSGWYRVFCTLRRHRVELLEAVTTARRALVVI